MFFRPKTKQYQQKQCAVIGLGRFGRSVVRTLSEKGFHILAIDKEPQKVQYISEYCTQAVAIDSTSEQALWALNIETFDFVVVAIGSDFESNLITTVALKALGVRQVICKARSQRQKDILLRVGADRVILPESEAGQRLGLELASPNLLEQISFGDSHSILELSVSTALAGKTLEELDFRNQYGANVVAIRHETSVTVSPEADQIIEENDIIVVIGQTEKISLLMDIQ
jgi:trk system potassium uptake protein